MMGISLGLRIDWMGITRGRENVLEPISMDWEGHLSQWEGESGKRKA